MMQAIQTVFVATPPQAYFFTHEVKPQKRIIEGYNTFLETFIIAVCDVFKISNQDLHSKSRKYKIKLARWIVWEAAIACENYTTTQAANIFGKYDHSSVVHALDTLQGMIESDKSLKILYDNVHDLAEVDKNNISDFYRYRENKSVYVSPKQAASKMNKYRRSKHKNKTK